MAIAINIASSIGSPKELSIASAVFLIIEPINYLDLIYFSKPKHLPVMLAVDTNKYFPSL